MTRMRRIYTDFKKTIFLSVLQTYETLFHLNLQKRPKPLHGSLPCKFLYVFQAVAAEFLV